MSRAFHPPETLSKDDIRTIANVRREIWTNGLKGLGVGTLAGFTFYAMASIGQHRLKLWKLPPKALSRNNAFLSVLLSGAIGSFLMSVTTGKNEVHHLHPIFAIGAHHRNPEQEKEDETLSTHLSLQELAILQQQQQQQQQSNNNSTDTRSDNSGTIDRTELERNRLYRRATLTKKMEVQGHRHVHHPNVPSSVPTLESDGRLLSDHEVTKPTTSPS